MSADCSVLAEVYLDKPRVTRVLTHITVRLLYTYDLAGLIVLYNMLNNIRSPMRVLCVQRCRTDQGKKITAHHTSIHVHCTLCIHVCTRTCTCNFQSTCTCKCIHACSTCTCTCYNVNFLCLIFSFYQICICTLILYSAFGCCFGPSAFKGS